MLASAAGFLLTNPFAIFDYPSFSAALRELMTHYDRPDLHPRNHGAHNWLFFLRTLAGGESDPFVMLTRRREWGSFSKTNDGQQCWP